jgi:hypothetical protein
VTISLSLVGSGRSLLRVGWTSKLVAFFIVKLLPDIPKIIFPNRTFVRVLVVESFPTQNFIEFTIVLLHCPPIAIPELVVFAVYPIASANVPEACALYPNYVTPSADCALYPILVE